MKTFALFTQKNYCRGKWEKSWRIRETYFLLDSKLIRLNNVLFEEKNNKKLKVDNDIPRKEKILYIVLYDPLCNRIMFQLLWPFCFCSCFLHFFIYNLLGQHSFQNKYVLYVFLRSQSHLLENEKKIHPRNTRTGNTFVPKKLVFRIFANFFLPQLLNGSLHLYVAHFLINFFPNAEAETVLYDFGYNEKYALPYRVQSRR